MPDKRTHAGQLNATTGRTHPPPLTEGHEMPPLPHVEDLIARDYLTWPVIAICASILRASPITNGPTQPEAVYEAAEIVAHAKEVDRHERLRYPKPAPEPLPPQLPAYRK